MDDEKEGEYEQFSLCIYIVLLCEFQPPVQ